jgi:hypothetical protein
VVVEVEVEVVMEVAEVVGVEWRSRSGSGEVCLVRQCQRMRLTLMMKRDRCGMWVLRLLRQRSPKRNGLQTGTAGEC